jgi:CheY-like chemotaxis protein
VIDTGIGISVADQAKVFQPFQQVGEASYKAQGTGLGLSISQNMVALLGGQLQLRSVLGQGSTFWFELNLPVVTPPAITQIDSQQVIRGLAHGPNTILVVDDVAENRQLLLDFLTPLGFKVEQAASGDEVLFKLQTFAAAAVITDLMMPGMDGFELVEYLRQIEWGYRPVIIAASASVFAEDAQRSLDLGCDAFLPKPIVFADLLATLERYLNLTWHYREITADEAPKMKVPSLAELSLLYDFILAENSTALQARLNSLKTTQLYPQFLQKLEEFMMTQQFEAMLTFIESVMV